MSRMDKLVELSLRFTELRRENPDVLGEVIPTYYKQLMQELEDRVQDHLFLTDIRNVLYGYDEFMERILDEVIETGHIPTFEELAEKYRKFWKLSNLAYMAKMHEGKFETREEGDYLYISNGIVEKRFHVDTDPEEFAKELAFLAEKTFKATVGRKPKL